MLRIDEMNSHVTLDLLKSLAVERGEASCSYMVLVELMKKVIWR